MDLRTNGLLCLLGIVALHAPLFATVTIGSLTPSVPSPQKIGASIKWEATATDSNAGPLTFQFNVAPPHGTFALARDFNVGKLASGTWTAKPFVWVPTGIEGTYQVQVVIKDFTSGETASTMITFKVSPLVTAGKPVVKATANPLVALFSAPSCPAGSTMSVSFQDRAASKPATTTNWVACHPPASMTFEIAGMYPETAYSMYSQTNTGGTITNGATLSFTTGALPTNDPLPTFKVITAGNDAANPLIIHGNKQISGRFAQAATDLAGNIVWYYYPNDGNVGSITRPLEGGGFLMHQDGNAWNPATDKTQFLRQIDLAGNIVRETNIGVIQQELVAAGAVDGGPCNVFPSPAPVGSACIGAFHHDSIMSLPNGYSASLVDIEKIFPPGTQGDTSGDPVDIVGDMIVVLDQNWQVSWYWDVFDPAGGGNGYPKLPVTRTAILGEKCGTASFGCPPMLLLGPGISPLAHDWLHANALYYWPAPEDGNTQGGDIIWSARHQDSIMRIDYQDGAGTGDILWRMGPPDNITPAGDFSFNNIYNDPWPWFSHQHEVGIENGGTGPMTIFDNGNTRISAAPLGLGSNCKPYDCNNRGMAVTFSETTLQVTPVLSVDLGRYSSANGSAQLLDDGNYFFVAGLVPVSLTDHSFSLEVGAVPATGAADVIVDIRSVEQYRGWQVPNLYSPPIT